MNNNNIKKIYYWIIIVIIITGVIIIGVQKLGIYINLSEVITPSKAYVICNEKSCTNKEVVINGLFQRNSTTHGIYTLSDDNKVIFIRLDSASLVETIFFEEQNYLLKGGIIEANIKGTLNYEKGLFCTQNQCQAALTMRIKPSNMQFIKKNNCEGSERLGYLGGGDCFDFSMYTLNASDAYNKIINSELCTADNRQTTGIVRYDKINSTERLESHEMGWLFATYSNLDPGGCRITSCHVLSNKIILQRTCLDSKYNLYLEEPF